MKIVLTGPHCSGKTTVLKKIKIYLEEYGVSSKVAFVESTGSRCPIDYANTHYLRSHPEIEIRLAYWMLANAVLAEIEGIMLTDFVVLDRCLLDQLVYPLEILSSIPREIEIFVTGWCRREPYDLLFLFPPNVRFLEERGTKDRDPYFQQKIFEIYLELVDRYALPYRVLPQDQDEQVRDLCHFITEKL